MSGTLFWIWGAGPKTPAAKRELERVARVPAGSLDDAWRAHRAGTLTNPPISDLAVDAVARLRHRLGTAPQRSLFFGAPSLQEMSGGLVTRCRERGLLANKVVFEDHGFVGGTPAELMLFFGRDAVSMRTLPRYERWFEQMRLALTPNAEIFLVHCFAAADDCRLARALSRHLDRPVYVADAEQLVGNQAIEGNAFRVYQNQVRSVPSFSQAVLHFD